MSAGAARPLPPDDDRDPGVPDAPGGLDAPGHDDEQRVRGALRLVAMREHSLLSLFELTQHLGGSADLFHLADLVLFNLMGQFGTSKAALWLKSEAEGAAPVLMRAHGMNRQMARAAGMACAPKLMSLAADGPGSFAVANLESPLGESAQKLAERAGIALFTHISGRDEPLGLLALGSRIGGHGYGPLEFRSLQAALSVLGVAIQNQSLYGRLAENNRQLRRANQEMEDLDRLKSEFLSNINHELRTPLSTIIGYVDCLLDPTMSPEHGHDMLKVVMEEALKLRGLVENLLSYSAASQDLLVLQMDEGDIGACLERYCAERRPGIGERLREFTWTVAPELPAVRFDEKRLFQVVDALVDNAVKFAPEGSCVRLAARRHEANGEPWVAIEITDDGPGIPADRLPTVFDVFRQADGSSTRAVGGLGIGLAFSRQLVMAMGGQITAASELGKGSTFTALLPAA